MWYYLLIQFPNLFIVTEVGIGWELVLLLAELGALDGKIEGEGLSFKIQSLLLQGEEGWLIAGNNCKGNTNYIKTVDMCTVYVYTYKIRKLELEN